MKAQWGIIALRVYRVNRNPAEEHVLIQTAPVQVWRGSWALAVTCETCKRVRLYCAGIGAVEVPGAGGRLTVGQPCLAR